MGRSTRRAAPRIDGSVKEAKKLTPNSIAGEAYNEGGAERP